MEEVKSIYILLDYKLKALFRVPILEREVMEDMVIFLVTLPANKDAEAWARSLIKRKLAACVNIFKVRSVYLWKKAVEEADETLLIIKTSKRASEKLEKTIKEEHPYELPEIIALKPDKVDKAYLKWILDSVNASSQDAARNERF